MTTSEIQRTQDLAQRLSEAEATIKALLAGEIDAVFDAEGRTPVLLAKAQQALRASEERYRRIVETTNEGVWLTDAAHKTTFMNRRMAQMLGCEAGMGLGRSPFEFLDEAERVKFAAYLVHPHAGQIEIRYTRTDGTSVWTLVEAAPLFDGTGAYDGSLAMVRDVTHGRLADAALQKSTADLLESGRLYRSTFDAAPVGIVHIGLDGQWLRINQRLCDLLGYSHDELERRDVRELVESNAPPGEAASLLAMESGTLDRYVVDEKAYRKRDGTFVWARVNMSVHRDSAGRAQYFIAVIEDMTEQRTLEAQVRQAGKMDAIGQLASGVAHDFNNLLTVILGFGEVLTEDETLSPRHRGDLAEITNAARRASGLTQQLLAFSRQQVLQAVPLEVNALISDMAGMLGRLIGEHIEVALTPGAGNCRVLGDRSQLEQVVMNLVVNARDAMLDGGRVTIETAEVDLENSSFHDETVLPGRYVMIAVTDTGCGMSKEVQRRLFEPFFTTKDTGKGTGLGLSTTYGIVKQSKGYIWVYSDVGYGTTFKVYLPCSTGSIQAPATPAAVSAPVLTDTGTVLLVEDQLGVRMLAKRILENTGYRVIEASDGTEAERLYAEKFKSIDLVLTDVVMPACGGLELTERLRTYSPDVKVLYMSGYTEQSAVRALGFDEGLPFVQKPFTAAELVRKVRGALKRTD